MEWTPDKKQFVKENWQDKSATQLAKAMERETGEEVSRNAVCGVIYRMRQAGAEVTRASALPPQPRKRKRKPNPEKVVTLKPKPAAAKPVPPPAPIVRNPNIMCPCKLVELESLNCRWPIGDPRAADFYFCGAVIEEGAPYPYCPTHLRQSVNPNTSRGQHAEHRAMPAQPVRTTATAAGRQVVRLAAADVAIERWRGFFAIVEGAAERVAATAIARLVGHHDGFGDGIAGVR